MTETRKPYGLTQPCDTCPFRTDIDPFLTPERVEEIQQGLVRGEFYCHKTTQWNEQHEDEEGERRYTRTGGEMHCAGALILLEKLEQPSQMMRIAERLRMYDRRKLKMDAPVFDTFEDMIEAQAPRRSRRRRLPVVKTKSRRSR